MASSMLIVPMYLMWFVQSMDVLNFDELHVPDVGCVNDVVIMFNNDGIEVC